MRGADLLILDEPTSNLSAPEVGSLMTVMRRLKDEGGSVIFISHKLGEVMEVCDEGIVLRSGRVASHFEVGSVTRPQLARMMVDRDLEAAAPRAARTPGAAVLKVEHLTLRDRQGRALLDDIRFSLRESEILALARVDRHRPTERVEKPGRLRLPSSG